MSPKVATWAATAFQGKSVSWFRYRSEALPYSNQTLHTVKAISDAPGLSKFERILGASFDKNGVPQPDRGRALLRAERKARYALFGAIRPALAARLLTAKANKAIPVMIWLNTKEPRLPREKARDLVVRAAYNLKIKAIHKAAQTQLMQNWKALTKAPIVFSDGAPVALAHLTPAAIYAIAKHPAVARIYYDTKPVHTNSTNWDQAVNATSTGVTGAGQEVCIVHAILPTINGSSTLNGLPMTNPYNCASGDSLLVSRWLGELINSNTAPYGVAKGALTPYGNWQGASCSGQTQSKAINWCRATRGAKVMAWPNTCPSGINDLLDYQTRHYPYPTIAVSADNGGASSVTSCSGYNVINVGASDHLNTVARGDDVLWSGTSSLNATNSDQEFPSLVAPGKDIQSGSGLVASGTSPATMLVAGAAAQIMEKNSSLALWNEAVRAILLCASDENVDGVVLDLEDNIDDKDGAGELNVGMAVSIADSANEVLQNNGAQATGFYYKWITQSDFTYSPSYAADWWLNGYAPFRAITHSRGQFLRGTLVWDADVTCTASDDASTCGSSVPDVDLDLWIWDPLKDPPYGGWWSSTTHDGTWEFKQFSAVPGRTYEIYVTRFSSWEPGVAGTYMALAWNFAPYNN